MNIPEFENLPPIKLIPLEHNDLTIYKQKETRRPPTDIRWVKVLEFLRSNNLASNSRKLYERELKWFLEWTQLHYHELRSPRGCTMIWRPCFFAKIHAS